MAADHLTESGPPIDRSHLLLRGRGCYVRGEWNDAFEALKAADEQGGLESEDLQRLAWSAGLTARNEEMISTQERVYHSWLQVAEQLKAARAAFWLGFRLQVLGESGRANGWLSRSQRLVELHKRDCVEQGYLMLPAAQQLLSSGELIKAHDCAALATQIGEHFLEPDLIAFARNIQGRALLADGHVERGLALMDEVMVAATAGELSPVVTGIVYCSAIASCQRVFALSRAREWTAALASWCDAHPQLGMFTGHCLVHRAEVLQLNGLWGEAAAEARRAVERCVRSIERDAAGSAHYQQAEIHRLRGEFTLARAAYHEASRAGFEPLPGFALLQLVEGDRDAAAGASRRALAAAVGQLARTRYLPAHVEIMLAVGDLEEARASSRELEETSVSFGSEVLEAIAAHACGSVYFAAGDSLASLESSRRAFSIWQRLGAPYLAARLRVLVARACIALGDSAGARLELQCASEVFERLGATPDMALVKDLTDSLTAGIGQSSTAHGLTGRELQVLRLIATGRTNKAIGRELSLSEKTIDRHVSNIFAKLKVFSRSAATAFAYENRLT